MNILDKIIQHKIKEVEQNKTQNPSKSLEKSPLIERPAISIKKSLQKENASGVIAEFKRSSPSKGIINDKVSPQEIAQSYQKAGASAMSILTDKDFFSGENQDLENARKVVELPLLRKDFIIDEYQIIEAKAIGADVILLIAAVLSPQRVKELAQFAKTFALEILLEVHNLEELDQNLNQFVDLLGVNNRNLKTFEVSIQTSLELVEKIPNDFVKISESGISQISTILELKKAGYQGFLIGENFMKTSNPGQTAQDFIQDLKNEKISL